MTYACFNIFIEYKVQKQIAEKLKIFSFDISTLGDCKSMNIKLKMTNLQSKIMYKL